MSIIFKIKDEYDIEDILVVDGDVVRLWGIIHDHRKPDCGFSMVLNRWYNDKASVMH